MPFDSNLFKGILKDFKIVDEFIVIFSLPIDFIQGNFSRVDNINNLAIDCTWSQLLNFG